VSQVAGAEAVVRTVPELIPAAVIESRADMKAGRDLQKDIPLVTADDFREAGAITFGTPTRFGNVSSQLKNQIDQLLTVAQGRTRGQAGWRLRVNREPSRRAGDNDPDADGALVAPRHDPCRSALLRPGPVHHSGWRFTLRAGSSGGRRQPARNRPARGGHLPRLGSPVGRSWTAVANEVRQGRGLIQGRAGHNQERG